MNRRVLLAGAAAALAAPGAQAAALLGRVRSLLPTGAFSVSGQNGKFLAQVSGRAMRPGGVAGEAVKEFTPGEYQSARLSMPATERRISALLDQLAVGWPYAKPPRIKVNMIASGTYGPLAMSDGSIAVPVGLLDRATTDDEVAFLLGHEYGHLALGHFARDEEIKSRRSLISNAADLYSTGVGLSQLRLQQTRQSANLTVADKSKVETAADKAVRAKERLDWVLNVMVEPSWNRNQEDEADAAGFDLAAAAKYSPLLAAPDVFAKLMRDDEKKDGLIKQMEDQLEQAVKVSAESNRTAVGRGDLTGMIGDTLSGGVTNLIALGKGKVRDYFSATHRPPAARQAGLRDYCDAAYPNYSPPDTRTAWLAQVRASPDYISALEAVNSLQAAQEARVAGDLDAARTAINRALKTSFGGLPLILNESARIYRDKKDFAAAETTFTRADAHPEQTLDGFSDHVQMGMDRGDYTRALAVIAVFKQRTGTDTDFLPQLVRIKFKQRQNEEGLKLLDRCMNTQQPALRERCSRGAFGPEDSEWADMPPATRMEIQASSNRAASRSTLGVGNLLNNLRPGGGR